MSSVSHGPAGPAGHPKGLSRRNEGILAHWFGRRGHSSFGGGVRRAVAACARGRGAAAGSGRSGAIVGHSGRVRAANQRCCGYRAGHRAGARCQRRRSGEKLHRPRPGQEHPGAVRCGRAGRCRCCRGELDFKHGQAVCHRPRHRRSRRRGQPVGNGRRRPVRVRRHPRCGARRQAAGHGRECRSTGAWPRKRRSGGDGSDLCFGRRCGAGAGRTVDGEGRAQGRPPRRRSHRMGGTLRAWRGRWADVAAGSCDRLIGASGGRPSAR